jgi:hypothetical protein
MRSAPTGSDNFLVFESEVQAAIIAAAVEIARQNEAER